VNKFFHFHYNYRFFSYHKQKKKKKTKKKKKKKKKMNDLRRRYMGTAIVAIVVDHIPRDGDAIIISVSIAYGSVVSFETVHTRFFSIDSLESKNTSRRARRRQKKEGGLINNPRKGMSFADIAQKVNEVFREIDERYSGAVLVGDTARLLNVHMKRTGFDCVMRTSAGGRRFFIDLDSYQKRRTSEDMPKLLSFTALDYQVLYGPSWKAVRELLRVFEVVKALSAIKE
jgi:hypothetical protein